MSMRECKNAGPIQAKRKNKFLSMVDIQKTYPTEKEPPYRDAKGRFAKRPTIGDIIKDMPIGFDRTRDRIAAEQQAIDETMQYLKVRASFKFPVSRWQKFKNKIRKLLLWRR